MNKTGNELKKELQYLWKNDKPEGATQTDFLSAMGPITHADGNTRAMLKTTLSKLLKNDRLRISSKKKEYTLNLLIERKHIFQIILNITLVLLVRIITRV